MTDDSDLLTELEQLADGWEQENLAVYDEGIAVLNTCAQELRGVIEQYE